MKIDKTKREELRCLLIDKMDILINLYKSQCSETVAAAVHLERELLKMGFLHIGITGQTCCGKSTSVNAMCKDVVVPENPMTATPVPVYIKYPKDKNDVANVIIEHVDESPATTLSRDDFLRKYCYNTEDMKGNNPARQRFNNDRYAVVCTDSELLNKNIVLLDTLGSCATEMDNLRTRAAIAGKVDLMIYMVGSSNLLSTDVEFIQCNLLGYHPNDKSIKARVQSPVVDTDHLIILCNDKSGVSKEGLIESISRIFDSVDCKLTAEQKKAFCDNNVFIANALAGRIDSYGLFDYVKYTPEGSNEKYVEDAENLNKKQKKISVLFDKSDFDPWKAFMKSLETKTNEMLTGNNSLVLRKSTKIIERFKEAMDVLRATIKNYRDISKDHSKKIDKLEKISKKLDSLSDEVVKTTNAYGKDMILCVQKCALDDFEKTLSTFAQDFQKIINQYLENVPKNLPKYSDFKKMTDAQKTKALTPFLTPILRKLMSKQGTIVRNSLWKLEGDDVPKKHYSRMIDYLYAQKMTFLGCKQEMDDAGITTAGVILPTAEDFETIANELEYKIGTAISESFDIFANEDKWTSIIAQYLPSVKIGFFSRIFKKFSGKTQLQLWQTILSELIAPLTAELVTMATTALKDSVDDKIKTAYDQSAKIIMKSYYSLNNSCLSAIGNLKLTNTHEETEKRIKDCEEKIYICNCAIKEIEDFIKKNNS